MFTDRGFDGASTRDIAARAGVTQPLLDYHFTSKTELWRAALHGVFAALDRAMGARAEGLRGVDALTVARMLVREFVAFSARHPQLHRIITQESKLDGPRMDWLVERHVSPLYEGRRPSSPPWPSRVPAIPPAHLNYILTGAGATMFVLGPGAAGSPASTPRPTR